jgi:molecular chaperone DnaK (HSP70)
VRFGTTTCLPIFSSVGDAAKNAFHSNPQNTVFDAKRLIGRKVNDADIAKDIKHWPFKVSEKGGKPVITVKYKGENKDFVRIHMISKSVLSLTPAVDA